jgi:hydroxyacylglutathione hydrolase
MLEIVTLIQGPVSTNTYLVGDPASQQAVVIDPAWDGEAIAAEAARRQWQIGAIWLTHAHFDHLGGAAGVIRQVNPAPPIALHPEDLTWYRSQGGAQMFGIRIEPVSEPAFMLAHGQVLSLGLHSFEVRHTPGHTPGHVVFICASEKAAFCGDVIFQSGIGRTDFPGGNYETLIHSILTQILSLPDDTTIYSGHGPKTTVGFERVHFL